MPCRWSESKNGSLCVSNTLLDHKEVLFTALTNIDSIISNMAIHDV